MNVGLWFAFDRCRSAVGRFDPEDDLGGSEAAGAQKTRQSHNFAGANLRG